LHGDAEKAVIPWKYEAYLLVLLAQLLPASGMRPTWQRITSLHRQLGTIHQCRSHPELQGRLNFTAYSAGSHSSGSVTLQFAE